MYRSHVVLQDEQLSEVDREFVLHRLWLLPQLDQHLCTREMMDEIGENII